jgi:hypothetical protein
MRIPSHQWSAADEAAYQAFKKTWYGQNIGRIMTTGLRTTNVAPATINTDRHYWDFQPSLPAATAAAPVIVTNRKWPFAARFLLGTIAAVIILRLLLTAAAGIYGYGLYAHWWH